MRVNRKLLYDLNESFFALSVVIFWKFCFNTQTLIDKQFPLRDKEKKMIKFLQVALFLTVCLLGTAVMVAYTLAMFAGVGA